MHFEKSSQINVSSICRWQDHKNKDFHLHYKTIPLLQLTAILFSNRSTLSWFRFKLRNEVNEWFCQHLCKSRLLKIPKLGWKYFYFHFDISNKPVGHHQRRVLSWQNYREFWKCLVWRLLLSHKCKCKRQMWLSCGHFTGGAVSCFGVGGRRNFCITVVNLLWDFFTVVNLFEIGVFAFDLWEVQGWRSSFEYKGVQVVWRKDKVNKGNGETTK